MISICAGCGEAQAEVLGKWLEQIGCYQVVIVHVPMISCHCDTTYYLETLLKIRKGLNQLNIESDSLLSFEEVTKDIS